MSDKYLSFHRCEPSRGVEHTLTGWRFCCIPNSCMACHPCEPSYDASYLLTLPGFRKFQHTYGGLDVTQLEETYATQMYKIHFGWSSFSSILKFIQI
ncbi:unnamed protein product [Litomosoides sigmodontis]|uniref:Uncharacterized protein n=1 Tax=Litomosoides sigmodontis TaxID=42156 RepID=A0A3P7JQ55_LITSI|nr:unnamed protein product [Litomosoides sigmodontis]